MRSLVRFENSFDDLADSLFRGLLSKSFVNSSFINKAIHEAKIIKDDHGELVQVELDVPGYSKEDLKISVLDNELLQVEGAKGKRQFKYTNTIAERGDIDSLKAVCKDGVLTITYRLLDKKSDKTRIISID